MEVQENNYKPYFIHTSMQGWDYATDMDCAAHAAEKSYFMMSKEKPTQ
jgi:hypothetical protein